MKNLIQISGAGGEYYICNENDETKVRLIHWNDDFGYNAIKTMAKDRKRRYGGKIIDDTHRAREKRLTKRQNPGIVSRFFDYLGFRR